jgi:hypothetical protein
VDYRVIPEYGISSASIKVIERCLTMRVEQMPHPIAAQPNQTRGGKSLERMIAGFIHKIWK